MSTQLLFSLIYLHVFAIGVNPYSDDITVTTSLSLHLSKAILALSSIKTSVQTLSSISIPLLTSMVRFLPYLIELYLLQQSLSVSRNAVIEDL